MSVVDEVVEEIEERLAAAADPDRAKGAKKYLKSERDFIGASVPVVRQAVAATVKQRSDVGHSELIAAANSLWGGAWFECRLAAVELLAARSDDLSAHDLELIESLIRDGETWAIVDPLAINVAGAIVGSEASPAVGAVLDRWSTDPDSFWVRRASMLALLQSLRDSDTEWTRFTRYADAMMDEQEFFIRKAIGWVARDVSRHRPDDVREWAEPRLERMSGVTRREVVKYL